MAPLWQSDSTVIHRFRIRADHTDTLSTQQRIGLLLRTATLQPSRLPPSAIMFVRKLRDATPFSRISDSNRSEVVEWERSINAQLDRMAAEAVRAADHAVPASAEAVVFAERAEMLACLALDWLKGSLRANWWWSTLFTSGGADSLLAREWLASPEFIPLAMEHLASRSQAVAFVAKLSDDLAVTLLDRVNHVFSIPLPNADTSQQLAETSSSLIVEEAPTAKPSPPIAPWFPFVPEADSAGLTPRKSVFLSQTLMLRRAPSQARSIEFQTAIAVWFAAATDHNATTQSRPDPDLARERKQTSEGMPSPDLAGRLKTSHQRGTPTQKSEADPPSDSRLPGPANSPSHHDREQRIKNAAKVVAQHHIQSSPVPLDDSERIASKNEAEPSAEPNLDITSRELSNGTEAKRDAVSEATALDPQRVQSAFAGVFFLINVALALNLYSDFTAPRGENLELDLWDLLSLLASQFVGDEIRDDALNNLLAEFAGRTNDEPPGTNFHPPSVWEIPEQWLREFPEAVTSEKAVREGRMQLTHPAGFVLKASPPPNAGVSERLHCWTDWLAAYIRARLVRAIGREDATQFVCRVSGTIEVTPMRVDIHYSLQTHPIEIRLAGLDRDPGWIPAAGRYVAYHFH